MKQHHKQLEPEVHTLSGAYAVDAVDDVERTQFDVHLARCPVCLGEVDDLRETVVGLARLVVVPVVPGLRIRLLSAIRPAEPPPRRLRRGRS